MPQVGSCFTVGVIAHNRHRLFEYRRCLAYRQHHVHISTHACMTHTTRPSYTISAVKTSVNSLLWRPREETARAEKRRPVSCNAICKFGVYVFAMRFQAPIKTVERVVTEHKKHETNNMKCDNYHRRDAYGPKNGGPAQATTQLGPAWPEINQSSLALCLVHAVKTTTSHVALALLRCAVGGG